MHKDCKLEQEEIEQLTHFTTVPLGTFIQLYVSDVIFHILIKGTNDFLRSKFMTEWRGVVCKTCSLVKCILWQ